MRQNSGIGQLESHLHAEWNVARVTRFSETQSRISGPEQCLLLNLPVLSQDIFLMCLWCDQAAGSGRKRGRSQVPEELSISHSHSKQAQTLPLPRAAWRLEKHPPRAFDSLAKEENRLCVAHRGNCWPSWKMGMCPKVTRLHTQNVLFVRKPPQAIFCGPYARCVLEREFSGREWRQLLAQPELHNKALWDRRI